MIDSAQDLADRLAQLAVMAAELGHAHGCTVQLRVNPDGLLVVAEPQGSDQHAAILVPWSDVIAHKGAVATAMNAMVLEAEQKQGEI